MLQFRQRHEFTILWCCSSGISLKHHEFTGLWCCSSSICLKRPDFTVLGCCSSSICLKPREFSSLICGLQFHHLFKTSWAQFTVLWCCSSAQQASGRAVWRGDRPLPRPARRLRREFRHVQMRQRLHRQRTGLQLQWVGGPRAQKFRHLSAENVELTVFSLFQALKN